MYYYTQIRKSAMAVLCCILLFSIQLSAQNINKKKQVFAELVSNSEAKIDLKTTSIDFLNHLNKEKLKGQKSPDEVFNFLLNDINRLMVDSEFFKMEGKKLILPFRSKVLTTIPQWVNTGGVNFEAFLEAKVAKEPVFDYLISCAAKIFKVKSKNVELRFFWFQDDESKLIGGPNTVAVSRPSGQLSIEVVSTENAADGISKYSALGDVQKYFSKGNWKEKVEKMQRD